MSCPHKGEEEEARRKRRHRASSLCSHPPQRASLPALSLQLRQHQICSVDAGTIIKIYRALSVTEGKEAAGKPLLGHGGSSLHHITGARVPEGCWRGGTNPIHPWSKQLGSPPSKLPPLNLLCQPLTPQDKAVLSQRSIAPNSCYRGNSISQQLRGYCNTGWLGNAMGDGMLQNQRLQYQRLQSGTPMQSWGRKMYAWVSSLPKRSPPA